MLSAKKIKNNNSLSSLLAAHCRENETQARSRPNYLSGAQLSGAPHPTPPPIIVVAYYRASQTADDACSALWAQGDHITQNVSTGTDLRGWKPWSHNSAQPMVPPVPLRAIIMMVNLRWLTHYFCIVSAWVFSLLMTAISMSISSPCVRSIDPFLLSELISWCLFCELSKALESLRLPWSLPLSLALSPSYCLLRKHPLSGFAQNALGLKLHRSGELAPASVATSHGMRPKWLKSHHQSQECLEGAAPSLVVFVSL